MFKSGNYRTWIYYGGVSCDTPPLYKGHFSISDITKSLGGVSATYTPSREQKRKFNLKKISFEQPELPTFTVRTCLSNKDDLVAKLMTGCCEFDMKSVGAFCGSPTNINNWDKIFYFETCWVTEYSIETLGSLTPDEQGQVIVEFTATCLEIHVFDRPDFGMRRVEQVAGFPNIVNLKPDNPKKCTKCGDSLVYVDVDGNIKIEDLATGECCFDGINYKIYDDIEATELILSSFPNYQYVLVRGTEVEIIISFIIPPLNPIDEFNIECDGQLMMLIQGLRVPVDISNITYTDGTLRYTFDYEAFQGLNTYTAISDLSDFVNIQDRLFSDTQVPENGILLFCQNEVDFSTVSPDLYEIAVAEDNCYVYIRTALAKNIAKIEKDSLICKDARVEFIANNGAGFNDLYAANGYVYRRSGSRITQIDCYGCSKLAYLSLGTIQYLDVQGDTLYVIDREDNGLLNLIKIDDSCVEKIQMKWRIEPQTCCTFEAEICFVPTTLYVNGKCVIVGGTKGVYLCSVDGGKTYVGKMISDCDEGDILKINMINPAYGYMMFSDKIYMTINAGYSWELVDRDVNLTNPCIYSCGADNYIFDATQEGYSIIGAL